jgi:UDP-3-O-[3-hydroxymyristoyl] glucosamine N-acyltransferase
MTVTRYSLAELAKLLQLECQGDADCAITALATLGRASDGQLSFLANQKYKKDLAASNAAAVILDVETAKDYPGNCLISTNPYLSYAKASQLFDQTPPIKGIHSSAVISPSADIADGVAIGAHCVVGDNVRLGEYTMIGPGCIIGNDCMVGANSLLHSNVTLYHDVQLGEQVIIHSAAVLGSDGFGFAPSDKGGWIKIAQLGGVRVGSNVEIGAGTTIDRGALDNTIIADGVILDNQIQIAHNVQIGENTAIAAYTGIAGSAVIGKNCTMAGRVSITGHINIVDNVHITACSIITKSIAEPGSYSSGAAGFQKTRDWKKNAVRFRQLNDLYQRVGKLEKKKS